MATKENHSFEKEKRMKKNVFTPIALFFLFTLESFGSVQFKVLHQVTGPIETNCYLIYDLKSKDAALVDPGGTVAILTDFIKAKRLKLKYIFITHQHIDHTIGVPDIRRMFPQAKLCMHKDEYRDFFTQKEWAIKNYGPEWFAEGRKNPEIAKFFDFDEKLLKMPEIFVEDNQSLELGSLKIRTILCPGHSPAGTCYAAGNVLFSGDVLFYQTVGRIDTQNGSKEEQIKSVRKLYSMFPDATIVYPGHGQFTNIGSEKRENKRITLDGGEWCTTAQAKSN
jgi:hydroxyacylglutathione hydrolase